MVSFPLTRTVKENYHQTFQSFPLTRTVKENYRQTFYKIVLISFAMLLLQFFINNNKSLELPKG
jgi:hypothetical protein